MCRCTIIVVTHCVLTNVYIYCNSPAITFNIKKDALRLNNRFFIDI